MARGAKDAFHGSEGGFPAALRAHRRTAGLTQEELAERAGVSVRTLRELERGRVLRPQRGTVALLADALGLAGQARERFVATVGPSRDFAVVRIPGQRRPDGPSAGGRPGLTAVPPRPDLVGRDTELAQLRLPLERSRLVTLTGLAGVGKTCLALAAVNEYADRFPAGVAALAMTDAARPDDVLAGVAAVFRVAREADLAERYGHGPALLLLDGADRSPQAAIEVIRWLRQRMPELTILVTSRHPLGVPEEVHRRVEPLDVPPAGDDIGGRPADLGGTGSGPPAPAGRNPDLAELRGYPAVALFLTRLYQVRPEPLTDADVPVLAELVRRLGGLPLALELAAARSRVLDLPELLERYRNRMLDLGTVAPEAQTVRDALAASYRLLEPGDRWALRRLCVFRARWSLELAEDLLTDQPAARRLDVEAVLDRLVGLGLVNVRPEARLRFRLLDMVREFAAEECERHGELAAARAAHAHVLTTLAARAAVDLFGPAMAEAVALLDRMAADVRAALDFATVHEPHTALGLAAAIARWCRFRGRDRPARALLRQLLDDERTADAAPTLRAWAALGAAMLAAEHGEGLVELPAAEAALRDFQASGDIRGELAARASLCRLWQTIGGYEEACGHARAALALAERTGRVREAGVAQKYLSWHDIRVADLAGARARLAAAAGCAAEADDERLAVLVRANQAEVERLDGWYDEAVTLGWEALEGLAVLGDPGHRIRALGTVGRALAESGRLAEAEAVLDELAGYGAAALGIRTMLQAYLALGRGEVAGAAGRFAAAADALVGRYDARDLLEAMVGAAACAEPDRRIAILAQLDAVRERGRLSLLPRDQALLARVAATPR